MSTASPNIDSQSTQADGKIGIQPEYVQYHSEDEISLIDLWLVLVKRKFLLGVIFSTVVLIGLVVAFVTPKKYTYATSIEIGSRIVKDGILLIEEPQTLLAKIQESYIPLVQQEYLKAHPADNSVYKVSARIPKGSEIIVLESKGAEVDAGAFIEIQQAAIDKVKHDHQRIIDVVRKEVEIERNKAQNKLAELRDEAGLLKAREKRLNDVSELLNKQIAETKVHIATVTESRAKAVKETKNEAKAMTLLMLDTDMQQQRSRLAKLEERLLIEVAEEQDTLEKKLADNKRAQANQQDQVSRLEIQLLNLRETRALVPPMRSNEPTGMSRKVILMLAMVLGAILAIFTAFFTEFLSKAKEQMDNTTSSEKVI